MQECEPHGSCSNISSTQRQDDQSNSEVDIENISLTEIELDQDLLLVVHRS